MESLLGFLSALKLHHCLLNVRIARESLKQNSVSWSATIFCFSPVTANAAAELKSEPLAIANDKEPEAPISRSAKTG